MLDPSSGSPLVRITDPPLQCHHPTFQIQSRSHIQGSKLVQSYLSVLQPISRLLPGLFLPILPIHRPLSWYIQLFYPVRSIPTFKAWTRRHSLYINPVPPVHLTLFHSRHFQLLGTPCPHISYLAPTYCVHIRLRTNKKSLHAQIPSQEY